MSESTIQAPIVRIGIGILLLIIGIASAVNFWVDPSQPWFMKLTAIGGISLPLMSISTLWINRALRENPKKEHTPEVDSDDDEWEECSPLDELEAVEIATLIQLETFPDSLPTNMAQHPRQM